MEIVRHIGQLGLTQAGQAHVILPVQVAHQGIFFPDGLGKGAVHGGVSPLDVPSGPLEMHVKNGLGQPRAQAEPQHLPAAAEDHPFQPQGLPVFQGQHQRPVLLFQGAGPLGGLPLQGLPVPAAVHLQAQGDVRRGQGRPAPVRAGFIQPVDVVALGVELLARQVSQPVHGVEIVEVVPGFLKLEAAGGVVLQPVFVVEGQGHEPQGLTLGVGVGSGIVVDNKVFVGSTGAAGEIGHMCVNPKETERCTCGNYGCLEQYCSDTGLVHIAKMVLEELPEAPSMLREGEITPESICQAAKKGDIAASEVMERFGQLMGQALTAVACTVNPQVFVIGGQMAQAGMVILKPIETYFRRYAFHAFRNTPFVLAELGEDAGIYGSVRMLFDEVKLEEELELEEEEELDL